MLHPLQDRDDVEVLGWEFLRVVEAPRRDLAAGTALFFLVGVAGFVDDFDNVDLAARSDVRPEIIDETARSWLRTTRLTKTSSPSASPADRR
jgi:hypothetical protein